MSVEANTGVENGLSQRLAMARVNSIRDILGFGLQWFLNSLNFVLDQFFVDPANTAINAPVHQLVTLGRAIYVEKRAENIEPLMGGIFCFRKFHMFTSSLSSLYPLLFAEVEDVLTHLGQSVLPFGLRAMEANDTSGDETDADQPCRLVR